MVDKNDSLLREVEDELRRERLAKLWDKYGFYLIGFGILLIAGIAGYQLWQSRQVALANEGGTLYEQASQLLADNKTDEALKAYETLGEGGHRGYATLAALQAAGSDLKAGKQDEALAQFEKIAKDSSADPLLKSFATLQAASLRLGKADLPEMQNRLNDLAADGNPWRSSARELLGVAAYKAGDIVAATKEFDRILSDQSASPGVAARVRVLMSSIMAATLAKATPGNVTAPAGETKAPDAPADAKAPAGAATASPGAPDTAKTTDTKAPAAASAGKDGQAPAPGK